MAEQRSFGFWHAVALIEAVAVLTAVAITFGPSKSGSDASLADWFFEDPSWWEDLLVNLLFSHLLIALLLLIGALMYRLGRD